MLKGFLNFTQKSTLSTSGLATYKVTLLKRDWCMSAKVVKQWPRWLDWLTYHPSHYIGENQQQNATWNNITNDSSFYI